MGAQFKIMSQSQLIFLVFTVITLILMNPSIINVNVTSASTAFSLGFHINYLDC